MLKYRNTGLISTMICCFAVDIACAQSAPIQAPREPSAQHERLRFFEGTWTTSDSTPEDGFREVCAWMPEGRRHMVCRSRWNTKSGTREGMSVFSFDRSTGKYIYSGFRSSGALVVQQGEEHNGRWVLTSEQGVGDSRVRSRVTIEPADAQSFNFLSESSAGDGPWKQEAKFAYRRIAQ